MKAEGIMGSGRSSRHHLPSESKWASETKPSDIGMALCVKIQVEKEPWAQSCQCPERRTCGAGGQALPLSSRPWPAQLVHSCFLPVVLLTGLCR